MTDTAELCSKRIYGNSYTGHPCRNKGAYYVNGKPWCGIHNPDRIFARKEAKANAREAEWARKKAARNKATARADRLSAAREGVVKALEMAIEVAETASTDHCATLGHEEDDCRSPYCVSLAFKIDAVRAVLKELEEANKS